MERKVYYFDFIMQFDCFFITASPTCAEYHSFISKVNHLYDDDFLFPQKEGVKGEKILIHRFAFCVSDLLSDSLISTIASMEDEGRFAHVLFIVPQEEEKKIEGWMKFYDAMISSCHLITLKMPEMKESSNLIEYLSFSKLERSLFRLLWEREEGPLVIMLGPRVEKKEMRIFLRNYPELSEQLKVLPTDLKRLAYPSHKIIFAEKAKWSWRRGRRDILRELWQRGIDFFRWGLYW